MNKLVRREEPPVVAKLANGHPNRVALDSSLRLDQRSGRGIKEISDDRPGLSRWEQALPTYPVSQGDKMCL